MDGRTDGPTNGPTTRLLELLRAAKKNCVLQVVQAALDKAREEGNMEEVDKLSKRLVKVTKEHEEEFKTLLKHMGVPYVQVGLPVC